MEQLEAEIDLKQNQFDLLSNKTNNNSVEEPHLNQNQPAYIPEPQYGAPQESEVPAAAYNDNPSRVIVDDHSVEPTEQSSSDVPLDVDRNKEESLL